MSLLVSIALFGTDVKEKKTEVNKKRALGGFHFRSFKVNDNKPGSDSIKISG